MKTTKNRLFDELKGSMISMKSMAITKGGTTTSDSNGTTPTGPNIDCRIDAGGRDVVGG